MFQMRAKLKKIENTRKKFTAVFKRYGSKTNWHGFSEKTILLVDVKSNGKGKTVTEHIWFRMTKGFEKLGELKEGDILQFDARVKEYTKGYKGCILDNWERPVEIDYKLNNPTKIKKLDNTLNNLS